MFCVESGSQVEVRAGTKLRGEARHIADSGFPARK